MINQSGQCARWIRKTCIAAAGASVLATSFSALGDPPTVTPLLRTGDVIAGPGTMPVRSIRSITANDLKGVAVNVLLGDNTVPVGREASAIWIYRTAGSTYAVLSLGSHAPVFPAAIDCSIGLASNSGGIVASSVLLARNNFLNSPMPVAGFVDSLWIGNMPVLVEGYPAWHDAEDNPLYFGAIRNAGIVGDGRAYCIADLASAPYGSPMQTGVLFESPDGWVWKLAGGGIVSGSTLPILQTDGIISVAFSSNGGRYAAIARFDASPETSRPGLVVDGILQSTGSGRKVMVGQLLPGTTGESWTKLYLPAVNEANPPKKVVMCAGETNHGGEDRYVILRNTSILARSGSVVGGETLRGPVQFLATNMTADYLAVWGIRTGAEQAVTVNGTIVLKSGDSVSMDATTTGIVGRIHTPYGVAIGPKQLDGHLKAYVLASVQPAEAEARDVLLVLDMVVGESVVCPVDWNSDGVLSVQDIFDFLADWFNVCTGQSGTPCNGRNADFNGEDGLDVQDIFDYLSAWFAGC